VVFQTGSTIDDSVLETLKSLTTLDQFLGFKEGENKTLEQLKILPSLFWTLSEFSMNFKSLTPLSYLMNSLEE